MKVKLCGVKKIQITGEYIRLDALLKFASIASTGGEAKILIQNGDIFVGGKPCTMRGKKVRPGDVVRYGGGTLLIDGAACDRPRANADSSFDGDAE